MLRRCTLPLAILIAVLALPPTGASSVAPDDPLPDGPGKKILMTACASCHELTEVTKFKGYYDAGEWRDIVTTMVKYGATLKDKEADVLVEYLAETLGRK